jgi:hypothetical protein
MTGGITLWHVPLSHYSEKARWALDFKRIPHTRRAILGGAHPLVWRERNAALRDRPGVQWVARMYARHRLPSADRVSAPDAEPATA